MKEIPAMRSIVTSKGQTVVPKPLRERFHIESGATLDWQEDGAALRVIKLEPRPAGSFLEGLRRLGRVPARPRDKRPDKAKSGVIQVSVLTLYTFDHLCQKRGLKPE